MLLKAIPTMEGSDMLFGLCQNRSHVVLVRTIQRKHHGLDAHSPCASQLACSRVLVMTSILGPWTAQHAALLPVKMPVDTLVRIYIVSPARCSAQAPAFAATVRTGPHRSAQVRRHTHLVTSIV
jgi:hypothetical protein